MPPAPRSTLFPYTTLFRSGEERPRLPGRPPLRERAGAAQLTDQLPYHRDAVERQDRLRVDRKSTRLNSSHSSISYAVFCLKKKKTLIMKTYAINLVGPYSI